MENLILKSPGFENGNEIPSKYTCDGNPTSAFGGGGINPPLTIEKVPANARSLVLIMDDPDATCGKTWDHWFLWNIAPETKEILENSVPSGAIQGKTSWNKNEYGGPCPPRGNPKHRYIFKLYALDIMLDLIPSASKDDLEKSMQGHILAQTLLIGRYGR